MAVEKILSVASIATKTLQDQTTRASQQSEALEKFVDTLIDNFYVQHISDSESKAIGADENSIVSKDVHFGVSIESLYGILE